MPVAEGSFYDAGGDAMVRALALATPAGPGHPEHGSLAGLAATGNAVDIRLMESWARALGIAVSSSTQAPTKVPIAEDRALRASSAGKKQIASALVKLGLPARCRWELTQDVPVRVSPVERSTWHMVTVNISSCEDEALHQLEIGDPHFAFVHDGAGWRQVSLALEASSVLQEGGAILALVDLDGDGVDEVLLKWTYHEGARYVLVRSDGRGGYAEVGWVQTGS